ncbi:hypothetical protein NC652_023046 [Populus alba x Populus x berolinensis]|nr:hypothetical protein NC652_023046 [Populus alba x Populus x berolinensis]
MNILSHRFAEKQLRAVRDVEQQLFFHFPSMESVWDPQAGGNHCCCCMLEHLFHRDVCPCRLDPVESSAAEL